VSKRDLGASVRQRLLNQAREQGRPFQELLQYYVMERFLYRLSKSKFRNAFVLKGALLLTAWRAPQSRPTMDIDLLGQTSNDLEYLRLAVQEICCSRVEPDGVEFRVETLEIQKIKEGSQGILPRQSNLRMARSLSGLAGAYLKLQDYAVNRTLIIGGTGTVGRQVLSHLSALGVQTRVLTRNRKALVCHDKLRWCAEISHFRKPLMHAWKASIRCS